MLKVLSFLKPFRGLVTLVVLLALAQALSALYLPRLMADIVASGIVTGNTRQIMITGAWMLVMALVGTACSVGGSYFSSKAASGFGRNVRNPILAQGPALFLPPSDRF